MRVMSDNTVKKLAFVDLDDTLIQSLRKCPPNAPVQSCCFNPNLPPEKGAYTTSKQRVLMSLLQNNFEVIPTTARNTASYQTLVLPFQGQAILNHGATILTEAGVVDAEWHEHLLRVLDAGDIEYKLRELYRHTRSLCESLFPTVRVRLIQDYGTNLYVLAKDTESGAENLRMARETIGQNIFPSFPDFYVHLNDNNLAFIPKPVSKQAAVGHLLAQKQLSWD